MYSSIDTAGAAVAANTLYAVPIVIPATATYDRIVLDWVSGTAGNVRLGIYLDNGGLPGALVVDAGEAVTSTEFRTLAPQSLTGPDKYWLAAVFSATPTVVVIGAAGQNALLPYGRKGASRAFTYAALPDPFGAGSLVGGTNHPVIWLRKA